jgi:dTMP kinase
MKQLKKGLFFTFEGGEGAGKSTLIEKIYTLLCEKGYAVLKTREPGGTKLGELIRDLLLHRKDFSFFSPTSELCLYLASRAQHVEELLLPALKEGKIILCDRFNDSSIAYQGYGRNLDIEEVKRFCGFASHHLIPDKTFFLDLDPQKGLERVRKVSEKKEYDRLESESELFHQKVRMGFYALAKQEKRICILDASLSASQVFAKAWEEIEKSLVW